MIVDTSALLAFFDRDEPDRQAVTAILTGSVEPLVVSPFVVAELDYLVSSRLGLSAELAVLGRRAPSRRRSDRWAPGDSNPEPAD